MTGLTAIQAIPLTQQELAARHREFLNGIQPLVQMKVRVYSYAMPAYAVDKDGRFEMLNDGLNAGERAYVAEIDQAIADMARRLGITLENAQPIAQTQKSGA